MKRLKVMLAFGTRPEGIKMAPLFHELRARRDRFDTSVCLTAQHRQMVDQVINCFDIRVDIDLNLMKAGQDLPDLTAAVLTSMRGVLRDQRPDVLLVHGDTTTTLAASMAAFYAGVRVGHVEAGLRTYDLRAPFPEEFNRQVTTKIAHHHFAPTESSRSNLVREGVAAESVSVTGNTVVDALFWALDRLDREPARLARLSELISKTVGFDWRHERYVLVTGHRRENFGEGFLQICRALKALATRYPTTRFVYPVHLNPNVQRPVNEVLSGLANVHLVDPLDYEPFVLLMRGCHLVLTDSGGIQEEAPSLGKPVLVMREVTERPEALEAGTVRLVGADEDAIIGNVCDLLDDESSYRAMSRAHNPYGDGHASRRIADILGTF